MVLVSNIKPAKDRKEALMMSGSAEMIRAMKMIVAEFSLKWFGWTKTGKWKR